MVAGGAECKVTGMGLLRQCLLRRVSTGFNDRPEEACRPFDRAADGTVMGEGAGIVVLEEWGHAQRRGVRVLAEVTGFGASCNFTRDFVAHEPAAEGISLALRKALAEARLAPAQIQLLVAHGLAVPDNDRAEAAGVRAVFADPGPELPVVATKSRIGNCGAGAAAIDLVTAVLAMEAQTVPPAVNCPDLPAEYGLHLPAEPLNRTIEHAAVSCHTFGGQTAAMVISRTAGDR
jgi:3-oxoacyl-[acyl-carrier-protein] synthase II